MYMSICPLALPPVGRCAALRQNLPAVAKTLLISSVVCALLTAVAWQLGFTSSSLATSLFIGEGVLFMEGLLSLALSCPKKVHKIPAKKQLDRPAKDSSVSPIPPRSIKQKAKSKEPKPKDSVAKEQLARASSQQEPTKKSDEQKLVSPVASCKLTKEELEASLNTWVKEPRNLEKEGREALVAARRKAKKKILKCYQNKSEKLDLSSLNIKSLPAEIFGFTWLTVLNLRDCNIGQVPEAIDRLTELKELNLEKNKLLSVPQGLFKCKKLEILNLSSNQLAELSGFICNLHNLRDLDLSVNRITALPEGLFRCTKLGRDSGGCVRLFREKE